MLLANGAGGATVGDSTYDEFVPACGRSAASWRRHRAPAARSDQARSPSRWTGAACGGGRPARRQGDCQFVLVKTAIHGGDPNWGRLIAVAGRANVAFELSRAAVAIGSIVLFGMDAFDEYALLAAEI